MLSSIILLRCHRPEGSGFPPVEYLYTIGPGESGERGGHLFRLGSTSYTNFRELRQREVPRIPLLGSRVNKGIERALRAEREAPGGRSPEAYTLLLLLVVGCLVLLTFSTHR